ncbi:Rne/Rng family ribonuclease [uncultured Celeribacter sp.]|uniref:Rne/Rng family ribonuclease n=1 Tax=uncultured Celeribacter sp. TaxID=1303376 RepID=UPI002AA6FF37|nr:Rne/Rng family ribonuclease [uncultured Celeribacter sp.]
MAKKMLIDATHAEETRVVVVDGNKVEEFDFESENKRQLAGNIYLAKVTRVEPSLQAAFVDYGGNRHGFLAFSEIHPDYYQIPVADREALLAEELAYAKALEEEEDKPKRSRRRRTRSRSKSDETQSGDVKAEGVKSEDAVETKEVDLPAEDGSEAGTSAVSGPVSGPVSGMDVIEPEASEADALIADEKVAEEAETEEAPVKEAPVKEASVEEGTSPAFTVQETPVEEPEDEAKDSAETADETSEEGASDEETAEDDTGSEDEDDSDEDDSDEEDEAETASEKDSSIENVADDDTDEEVRPKRKPRPRRYKIQEVVKVRQVMLVQVVKEERGNKGAALTTYLSLAGRYCVLMPNTARGGGISRKITNAADRKKLKEIAGELEVPQGAGLIIRTAGAQRTKTEIKRDYDYLKRMWEQIRELTLQSVAPAKIYEEGDLIKRSIRDLYNKDIDEVFVEGEMGYREAKDFMKMIMPSHAKNVKHYADQLPLFARYQVESYLAGMFNPTVQLKSGGYIVIDVTEALVAVDVNSGRATKEGSIEDTALKTNLEAAEEVARQARLRDLAGLIVIDFIDMEERRNNTAVEKRLKDKLKTDRARIQVGRISGFGLLEMSRQRLRPGMLEATTQPCPHCHGTGLIRSDDNMALSILRQLEEEGTRKRSREVLLKAPVAIVNYLMNMKREKIAQIEARYGMAIRVEADPFLISPDFSIEKFKTATRVVPEVSATVISASADLMSDYEESEEEEDQVEEAVASEEGSEDEQKPKKRRRRRRRRKSRDETGENDEANENGENGSEQGEGSEGEADKDSSEDASDAPKEVESADTAKAEEAPKKRTRTRRKKAEPVDEAAADADAQPAEEGAEAPGDDKSVENKPAEEKPKRTRTRRKKAEEPAADAATEGAAEAVSETAAEEKPKPKRKRRTKAEIEADKAAKAAAEAEKAAAEQSAVEVTPETAAPESAVPETVSEEVVADPTPEAAPEVVDSVVAEAPVETASDAAPDVAPEAEPTQEPAQDTVTEPANAEAEPEADKPKRRGWWSR